MTVDRPVPLRITEEVGGSTAAVAWFSPDQIRALPLTDVAAETLRDTSG
ncbi:hypothetical protein O7632_06600 [Solwaraspora sp. WMMD406]|nr:hypothetical protein [Solwaraspora sp. WMMD406]MDG4763779.1 hypothetical protein [Solwaraspora sp. WMMD406]